MKAKYLLVLTLCLALPALACRAENGGTYDGFMDGADIAAEQTADDGQTGEAEQGGETA